MGLTSALLLGMQLVAAPYADEATRLLVERARARHATAERALRDYTALVRTRIDTSFRSRPFARVPPFVSLEVAARVEWSNTNTVTVRVVGQRVRSIFGVFYSDDSFNSPWFVPSILGDSVQFMDGMLPPTAALHPLASEAADFYSFAIADSLRMDAPGRTVHAYRVRVSPTKLGSALLVGDMWVDRETGDVIRFSVAFVGPEMWGTMRPDFSPADSARNRRLNRRANQYLTLHADLEYALHDNAYWVPHRQIIEITGSAPFFVSASVPIRSVSTFHEVRVNQGVVPRFTAPPSPVKPHPHFGRDFRCADGSNECSLRETGYYRVGARVGVGRYELHYPPVDSQTYEWPDKLELDIDPELEERYHTVATRLSERVQRLAPAWRATRRARLAYRRLSDTYRFNRVQGSSLGVSGQFRLASSYSSLVGGIRFSLDAKRWTGEAGWLRESPSSTFEIAGYRDVREVEPWTRGISFPNSLRSTFVARDDADYYFATGAAASYRSNGAGFWREFALAVRYEHVRSLSAFPHGDVASWLGAPPFAANPAIAEGRFVAVEASRQSRFGTSVVSHGAVGVRQLNSANPAGGLRGWLRASVPFAVLDRRHHFGITLAGATTDAVPQLRTRIGGPQTVRGFSYGERWGTMAWAAQLDLALVPLDQLSPVLFIDIGDAYGTSQRRNAAITNSVDGPMIASGFGISALSGLLRLDLAYGVRPHAGWRLDFWVDAPR